MEISKLPYVDLLKLKIEQMNQKLALIAQEKTIDNNILLLDIEIAKHDNNPSQDTPASKDIQ